MGKRAVVIGFKGRIGSLFKRRLQGDGWDVVGIEKESVLPVLTGSHVFYFGGNPDPKQNELAASADEWFVTMLLHKSFAEAAACVVLASSEWASLDPRSPYGKGKLFLEERARQYPGAVVVDRIGHYNGEIAPPSDRLSAALHVTPDQLYERIMARVAFSEGLMEAVTS